MSAKEARAAPSPARPPAFVSVRFVRATARARPGEGRREPARHFLRGRAASASCGTGLAPGARPRPSLGPAGVLAPLAPSSLPLRQELLTQAGDGAAAPVVRWSLYLVSSTLMSYGLAHENIMCKLGI